MTCAVALPMITTHSPQHVIRYNEVERLFKSSVPVDSIDENGNTVLMHACQVCDECARARAHGDSPHTAERSQTHSASRIALRCKY